MEEKRVWDSKYFSLNDPFEFNGMYLDEERILASGNDVETFYEYWKYITDSFITVSFCAEKEDVHPLNNMPMWAYYANNHHGICVEYNVCNPICLYPVSYEQEKNPMSVVKDFTEILEPAKPHKYWLCENLLKILALTSCYYIINFIIVYHISRMA